MGQMGFIGRVLLIPAAFFALANGSSALTIAELEGSDAVQAAARLLPPGMAQKVVSREILDPYLAKGPPAGVRFRTRTEAVGEHLCARSVYSVALRLAADGDGAPIAGSLEAASAPVEQVEVAYAERCAAPEVRYAAVQSATLADAAALLHSLASLQATAKAGQVPAAQLNCRSDIAETACAPSAVSVLARLPLDAVATVEGRGGGWRVVIADLPPDSPVWEIALEGAADAVQAVALHRRAPEAF
ncbi:MAG TPA: hypothetical protein VFF84_03740 [Sphingobium sp.]|nr:hypothetical protein [Sphingobium sp.]